MLPNEKRGMDIDVSCFYAVSLLKPGMLVLANPITWASHNEEAKQMVAPSLGAKNFLGKPGSDT